MMTFKLLVTILCAMFLLGGPIFAQTIGGVTEVGAIDGVAAKPGAVGGVVFSYGVNTNTNITFGSEILTDNPGFEYGDTSYWIQDNGTKDYNTDPHTGGYAGQITVSGAEGQIRCNTLTPTPTLWFKISCYVKLVSGTGYWVKAASDFVVKSPVYADASYTYRSCTIIAGASGLLVAVAGSTGAVIYLDDASMIPITFSSMIFSSATSGSADGTYKANITCDASYQGGLIVNLDSIITPANFVMAVVMPGVEGGAICNLYKSVGGVVTQIAGASGGVTYSAGAELKIIKSSTTYSVYYNGTQVGTNQTISDAGIISNTLCGKISTDSTVTISSFSHP